MKFFCVAFFTDNNSCEIVGTSGQLGQYLALGNSEKPASLYGQTSSPLMKLLARVKEPWGRRSSAARMGACVRRCLCNCTGADYIHVHGGRWEGVEGLKGGRRSGVGLLLLLHHCYCITEDPRMGAVSLRAPRPASATSHARGWGEVEKMSILACECSR